MPFWQTLIPPALAVLFLALTAAAALGSNYLAKRAQTSKAFTVLANFWEVVRSTVAHADAELRPTITAALADGRLTPEEAKAIKAKAVALIKDQLGTTGLTQLQKTVGLTESGLATFLSGAIERAVAEKNAHPVVAGLPAPLVAAGALPPR